VYNDAAIVRYEGHTTVRSNEPVIHISLEEHNVPSMHELTMEVWVRGQKTSFSVNDQHSCIDGVRVKGNLAAGRHLNENFLLRTSMQVLGKRKNGDAGQSGVRQRLVMRNLAHRSLLEYIVLQVHFGELCVGPQFFTATKVRNGTSAQHERSRKQCQEVPKAMLCNNERDAAFLAFHDPLTYEARVPRVDTSHRLI
jgi:hypothetical protein